MGMTDKNIMVNIYETASVWSNIAMGCKACFYVCASILMILCIIWLIKNLGDGEDGNVD